MEVLLSYGKLDGKIVHISEVRERGAACGCVCPACGGVLVAKLGKGIDRGGRRPHFAHMPGQECDTLHAQQTGLHLMAKEILAENNEIRLPGWKIERADVFPDDENKAAYPFVEIELPSTSFALCKYEAVELEKGFPGIVADAVITIRGRACAVEIAVTHFVDEEKTRKTEDLGLPMFEIDLEDMIDETDRDRIADAVLRYHYNRKWIYNPKQAAALKEKREEFKQKAEIKAAELAAEEERKKASWAAKKENSVRQLQDAFLPENYAKIIRGLRNDKQAAAWLKRFSFSADDYPFYMDIPITGEFVFPYDRRIWQGFLFDEFIYKGFGEYRNYFTTGAVKDYVFSEYSPIKFDKTRIKRTTVILGGKEREISLSYDVVRRYIMYLILIGFVSVEADGYHLFADRPASIRPPKEGNARALAEILSSVDLYDPDIDSFIDREIEARKRPFAFDAKP